MAKRKSISVIDSLGRVNTLPSIGNTRLVSTDAIISMANKLSKQYGEEAYNLYNASLFPEIKLDVPTISPSYDSDENIIKNSTILTKPKKTSSSYSGDRGKFVNDIYESYYKAVRPGAASDAEADKQARFLTQKAAFETGWGKHIANTHNYGGHKGKNGWLSFNSMDDFTRKDVALLDKKWSNWRTAKNEGQFIDAINTNNGYGMYAPPTENTNYKGRYSSLTSRINNTIDMKRKLRCGGRINRPKAFLGAVIGAFGSIAGDLIKSNSQEKIAQLQKEAEDRKYYTDMANSMTRVLNNRDAQEAYEKQFRVAYAGGGRRRLRQGVEITDGGPVLNLSTGGLYYAGDKVPYGKYVDLGPTHEERNSSGKTGTGWNINGKKIETENKEVETISPTQMKVYSNSLEFPNGMTPAEYVLNGGDENYAFNVQQNMNGNYGIGNKRRLRNGGYLSRPVGRIEARKGLRQILKDAYNSVRDSWVGDIWRAANYNVVGNSEGTYVTLPNGKEIYIPGIQGGAPNVLPGRVGGFRPQNIERGVRATRNIANTVRQSVRRATPVNASKAATKAPKTINVPKGDVVNHAKQQVKGYNWLRSEPIQQGYQGAVAGRGTMMGDPYSGQLNIGLSVGDRLRSVVNNAPVVPLGIGLGAGVSGGLYSAIDNNDNGNREYVYGQARGNNAAPYNAIQIGASVPTLNRTNVSIPSIDNYYNEIIDGGQPTKEIIVTGKRPNTSNTSTVTERTTRNNRRTLSSRGTKPSTIAVNNSTVSTPSATFAPDYTEQQMLDYINSNRIVADNTNNSTYTNPNEAILREMASKDPNYNGTNTNINGTTTEFDDITGNTNKWGTVFKGSDWIGLGADIAGSLFGGMLGLNTANNLVMPKAPAPIQAVKLPTTYSIGSDLATTERNRGMMLRDARYNTSSSMGLNTKRNLINLATADAKNQLYQTKQRAENEMLTKDALNQQEVAIRNNIAYNNYLDRLNEMQNRQALLRGNAWSTMFSGLSDAVGNFLDQGKQRYSDELALNSNIIYGLARLDDKNRNWAMKHLRLANRNNNIIRI